MASDPSSTRTEAPRAPDAADLLPLVGDIRSTRPYLLSGSPLRAGFRRGLSILALVCLDIAGLALGLYAALWLREVYHGRARLLRPGDRVRFLPRKGGSGRVMLTGRPWDGEGAAAGGTANLASHGATGGGTPFAEFVQTRAWRLGG